MKSETGKEIWSRAKISLFLRCRETLLHQAKLRAECAVLHSPARATPTTDTLKPSSYPYPGGPIPSIQRFLRCSEGKFLFLTLGRGHRVQPLIVHLANRHNVYWYNDVRSTIVEERP